jgi:hypothetical protein
LGIGLFPAFLNAIFEDQGRDDLANHVMEVDVSLVPSILLFSNAQSSRALSSKRAIVEAYCTLVLSDGMLHGKFLFSGNQTNFNSKNSLFARGLCQAWNELDPRDDKRGTLVPSVLIEGAFKENFVPQLRLQQMKGSDDVCFDESNESCDIARYSSRVYTTLMSDIFKIKWAHFLQVESAKVFAEKTDRIAKVFEVFFATQLSTANRRDYLLLYPKTAAMIDNNQQFFFKSLQSLVMLDNDKLFAAAIEEDEDGLLRCHLTGAIVGFVCGLHMPGQLGTDPHFVNFLMNEYLNYRLFVDFYINQQSKRIIQDDSLWDPGPESTIARESLQLELLSLAKQRDMYEQALRIALIDFQGFSATYPMHLGMVWYQEQLLRFRDAYASKMVTPFYSLYEKLRNVQPPEK